MYLVSQEGIYAYTGYLTQERTKSTTPSFPFILCYIEVQWIT